MVQLTVRKRVLRHFRRQGLLEPHDAEDMLSVAALLGMLLVAQDELDRWRLDYNTVRPHGSLRRSTPAQVGAGAYLTPSPERLQHLRP